MNFAVFFSYVFLTAFTPVPQQHHIDDKRK